MSYLDRSTTATTTIAATTASNTDFGWWLKDLECALLSFRNKNHQSSGSTVLKPSHIDSDSSDDSDNYNLVRDLSRREPDTGICEEIELSVFAPNIDEIEEDDREMNNLPTTVSSNEYDEEDTKLEATVYHTPEELIRSDYHILHAKTPRRFPLFQAGFTPEKESPPRISSRCRKRLSIDYEQTDTAQPKTQAKTFLDYNPISTSGLYIHHFVKPDEDLRGIRDRSMHSTWTVDSSRSNEDRPNSTWDNRTLAALGRCPLKSRYGRSGTLDHDRSLDTRDDTQNTPMRLSDELAFTLGYTTDFTENRNITINEVMDILEGLQDDPKRATVLLEDDRFCESMSTHDQLTRLALAIEMDTEVPAIRNDSGNWIYDLLAKIERLHRGNKEIHRDVYNLRTNFQCDERKTNDLSNNTRKLRQDIYEMRTFDDLLNLLQGKLEKISTRNWPFLLRHTKPHGELNLII